MGWGANDQPGPYGSTTEIRASSHDFTPPSLENLSLGTVYPAMIIARTDTPTIKL